MAQPPRRNPFNQPPSMSRSRIGLPVPGASVSDPTPVGNKTGLPTVAGDRMIATAHAPRATQGELRTALSTYFTAAPVIGKSGASILYNADRLWAKVTLTLEDAGPVVVGTQQDLVPILSGKGILLTTNVPISFVLPKGNPLYIAAAALNRVKVQIEPLPWLEQITATLALGVDAIRGIADDIRAFIRNR